MNWYKKAIEEHFYNGDEGFINGYYDANGYFHVDQLVVPPLKRGMGLSHRLIEKIPQKAILIAQPLFNMPGKHISEEALIDLYKSHGFVLKKDDMGNNIMVRE